MGIKKLKQLTSQTGDTIVEVVIAITVLGIVLGAAAVTANHNAHSLQDTQEHTAALKLSQAQLEYFREYIQGHIADLSKPSSDIYPGKEFCLYAPNTATPIEVKPITHPNCRVNSAGQAIPASSPDIPYAVSVELKSEAGNGYVAYAKASWEGIQAQNPNVGLSYRFHDTIGAAIGGSNSGGTCPAGYDYKPPPLGCVRNCGFYGMVALDSTDGYPAPDECGYSPTVNLSLQSQTSTTMTFTWATTGDFNQTECKYDSGPWASCTKPRTVPRGNPGETHTFYVRVFGLAGQAQDSESWTVPYPVPAAPSIYGAASGDRHASNPWDGEDASFIDVTVVGQPGASVIIHYTWNVPRYDAYGGNYSYSGAQNIPVTLDASGRATRHIYVDSVNRDCVSFPSCPVSYITMRARQTVSGQTSNWSGNIEGQSYTEWTYAPVSYWPTIQYGWYPVHWVTWLTKASG